MSTKILRCAVVYLVFFAVAAQTETAVKCPYRSLGQCPQIGCSKPGSPLAATNFLKRTTTINGNPTEINFSELDDLQKAVTSKFPAEIKGFEIPTPRSMKAEPREILLSGLRANGATFNEGDYVELSGYIAAQKLPPHPNTGESVNCKLKGEPNNDYHINITPTSNSDETKGVVVEMIPQDPHRMDKRWNLIKLKTIQEKQLPVKIQGRLFFDNEHVPNTTGAKGGNPRRFSVWEIHPISAFFVCPSGSCTKGAGWKALEDWEP